MTAEPAPIAAPASPVLESKPQKTQPTNAPGDNLSAVPDAEPLARLWERVIQAVEAVPSLAVAIESMRPVERAGSTLRLKKPDDGVKFSEVQREKLESEIERLFGSRLRVEVIAERAQPRAAQPEHTPERDIDAAARERAMANPVVRKATELFDARIIRVERESPPAIQEADDV